MNFFLLFLLFLNFSFIVNHSFGQEKQYIYGIAHIVDADTIVVKNIKIRFFGIDAPEQNQLCEANNIQYSCGTLAKKHLEKIINDKIVRCIPIDNDGRVIAKCYVNNININKKMVRDGWAIAYRYFSKEFVKDESFAKEKKHGIWQGSFVTPRKWRKNPKNKCRLKGNIEINKKVLYTPVMLNYNKIEIHVENGERWFCTVEEAAYDGWHIHKNK